MLQEVVKGNEIRRQLARRLHDAKTNKLPLNINVGDYVLVLAHAKRSQELGAKWHGPMHVQKTKSNLLFSVQDIVNKKHLTIHAQSITPYPVSERQLETCEGMKAQDVPFGSTKHLLEDITGRRKSIGEYELRIK